MHTQYLFTYTLTLVVVTPHPISEEKQQYFSRDTFCGDFLWGNLTVRDRLRFMLR
jgi:hypothetical protein